MNDTLSQKLILTIDGPAAAGKGTISYLVAHRYGLLHLDSGAFYRAAAWLAGRYSQPVTLDNEQAIEQLLQQYPISVQPASDDGQRQVVVTCDGQDISQAIRAEGIGQLAAVIGGMMTVRQRLTQMQRQLATSSPKGVVAEGRDTGIMVFPEAQIKIFLTAAPEVRAHRRHAELAEAGQMVDYEQVYSDLQERDRRDTERQYSSLRVPPQALVIDSSAMTIEQIMELVDDLIDRHYGKIS